MSSEFQLNTYRKIGQIQAWMRRLDNDIGTDRLMR